METVDDLIKSGNFFEIEIGLESSRSLRGDESFSKIHGAGLYQVVGDECEVILRGGRRMTGNSSNSGQQPPMAQISLKRSAKKKAASEKKEAIGFLSHCA